MRDTLVWLVRWIYERYEKEKEEYTAWTAKESATAFVETGSLMDFEAVFFFVLWVVFVLKIKSLASWAKKKLRNVKNYILKRSATFWAKVCMFQISFVKWANLNYTMLPTGYNKRYYAWGGFQHSSLLQYAETPNL